MSEQSVPRRPENGGAIQVHRLKWPPEGWFSEIVRLYVQHPHGDRPFLAMGLAKEEIAAHRFGSLSEPACHILVAEQGHRLLGLLAVEFDTLASRVFDQSIWHIRHLILQAGAPTETADRLVQVASKKLGRSMDLLTATIPASDSQVIHGLLRQGFRSINGQAEAVCTSLSQPIRNPARYAVVPMRSHHLPSALAIARTGPLHGSIARTATLEPDRLGLLQGHNLAQAMHRADHGALVAITQQGEVLGFISYRTDRRCRDYSDRDLACVEQWGLRHRMHLDDMEEMLHRHALARLAGMGVDAVQTRTCMTGAQALRSLDTLRRVGYQITASNLIMHCWLSEKRSTRGFRNHFQTQHHGHSRPGAPAPGSSLIWEQETRNSIGRPMSDRRARQVQMPLSHHGR